MDISIIIPTLNRVELLETTLKSILQQKQSAAVFEVIVVDNGSTDATRELCEKYNSAFTHFIYSYDAIPGQLTGRHKGLELASGDLLSYLDDDVDLNPEWVYSIFQLSCKHPEINIFGGPSLPKFEVDPPNWLNQFWEATPYGGEMCLPLSLIDLQTDCLIDPLYVFGLNFSIRTKTLLKLKGFHPDCIPSKLQRYQGDGETGLAIKAGMSSMKALHSSRLTLHHQITAERLTPAYFRKWSFYNGVCQSFTDLRYSNGLYSGRPIDHQRQKGFQQKIRALAKKIRAHLFSSASHHQKAVDGITEAYHDGYAFHRHAFLHDKKVRDWVLKPDYLDYQLPA